jgi:putative photosynthetic complex assembly protein
MHAHHAPETVPRRALLGAGALIASTFLMVGVARLAGFSSREPDAAARIERTLRFLDRSDGGIDIVDVARGERIDIAQGEQGFLRGTLRSIARERRRRGLGADAPLQLVGHVDGRVTLVDPAAGTRIDLESFGPTNVAVFARWLDAGTTPQPR